MRCFNRTYSRISNKERAARKAGVSFLNLTKMAHLMADRQFQQYLANIATQASK